MYKRNKAVVGEFLFTAIGDRDLGRAFHRHFALVGLEGVRRQTLDQSAAFNTANGNAPAVHRERFCQACSHSISGVAPQIFLVVGAVNILFEAESLSRLGSRSIWLTHEHVRQCQADITRIFRLTEAAPLHILRPVEDLRDIADVGHFRECVPTEKLGRGRAQERCMRRSGNFRDPLD